MKEQILKLREEGKTYSEIQKELGCSKGTISYHCGEGQKEKSLKRCRKRRQDDIISVKIEKFKSRKKCFTESVRKFQKRNNIIKGRVDKKIELTFTKDDVLNKIGGYNAKCYLSGESINIKEDAYHLDHILPVSRGGDNSIGNLGVTKRIFNLMKHDLTVEEFIENCKKVLENFGYVVNRAVV